MNVLQVDTKRGVAWGTIDHPPDHLVDAGFLGALDLRYASTRAMGGQARALEVILSGPDVHAAEARALGWIDVVTEPDELAATVTRVAERIAAAPSASIAAVKAVVDTSMAGLDAALTAESAALTGLIDAGSHRDRMARFLAANGQTRAAERGPIEPLLDAMRAEG